MIIPIKLELNILRNAFSNYVILFITIALFFVSFSDSYPEIFSLFTLKSWNPVEIIGSMFLHADIFHLFSNMLFLFVFGNALARIFGDLIYPFVYLFLGIMASIFHLLLDGNPAVGASGAISGLTGIILVWFPKTKVKFFYFFWFYLHVFQGFFRVKVVYVVALFLVIDMFGIFNGGGNTAHFAHIGGLLTGISLAVIIQLKGLVTFDETTLLDIFQNKSKGNELISETTSGMLYDSDEEEGIGDIFKQLEEKKLNEIDIKNEEKVIVDRVTKIEFKVLRMTKNKDEIKCYIQNKGDTLKDVSISSEKGFGSQIIPNDQIRENDAGVITFKTNGDNISEIEFSVNLLSNNNVNDNKFILNIEHEKIININDPVPSQKHNLSA